MPRQYKEVEQYFQMQTDIQKLQDKIKGLETKLNPNKVASPKNVNLPL